MTRATRTRLFLILALLAATAGGVLGQTGPAKPPAQRGAPQIAIQSSPAAGVELRLRQVRLLITQGNHEKAREILVGLLRDDPESQRVLSAMGDLLEAEGRFDEAVALYEGEIKAGRNVATYLLDLTGVYQASGRIQEALETVFRFLDVHPERIRVAQDLIESLIRRSQLDDAGMTYLEAEARRRADKGMLRLVADARVFAGQHEEAVLLMKEADLAGKAKGGILFPLVAILRDRGRPDLALAVIQDVLAMDPPGALAGEALLTKARVLRDEGRGGEAVTAYEEVVARFPDGPLARLAMKEEAEFLRDKEIDFGRARTVYKNLVDSLERARGLSGRDRLLEEATLGLGECALWEGLWSEAESSFVKIVRSPGPDEVRERASFMAAETRFFRGDFPGAEEGYYGVTDSFPGGGWMNDALERILFLQEHALAGAGDLQALTGVLLERRRGRPDSALVAVEDFLERKGSEPLADDFLHQGILCRLDLGLWDGAVAALAAWPDSLAGSRLAPRSYARVAEALVNDAARTAEGIALYEELLVRYPASLESRRIRPQLQDLRGGS
jgi:tetratricopeptide (TPR) repeat protein